MIDNVIDTISSGHGHFNTERLFYDMDSKHFYMYKWITELYITNINGVFLNQDKIDSLYNNFTSVWFLRYHNRITELDDKYVVSFKYEFTS